ncbi:predicted protein [Botrytis cinerea T4]|uniref:Uncharacterized protein n=1 Tax=Botryotinia fuckeliana (strain T4) TaxID=999810 RepID=G2YPX6_BOTF4|nr:predicted protein [Botrytis cinerea T4]
MNLLPLFQQEHAIIIIHRCCYRYASSCWRAGWLAGWLACFLLRSFRRYLSHSR